MMVGRIDVRRTEGGLRLLVPVVGERPRRSVRLSYAQAGTLITAIRDGKVCSEDGRVSLRADIQAREAFTDACTDVYVRDGDLRDLGIALSAHMPERMVPLRDN